MEWFNKNKKLVIIAGSIIAAIVVVLLVWLSIATAINNTRNEGEVLENKLTATYNKSVLSLGTCIDEGRVAAQVTEKEYATVKAILVETAAARYVTVDGERTNATDALGGGQFISALHEEYPEIDQRSWQNLQTLVVGCRERFKGTQEEIQFRAASFENWIELDDPIGGWIKDEFPSDDLKIQVYQDLNGNGIEDDYLYGEDAFTRIMNPVTAEGAKIAFDSGVLEEQDVFGDENE